MNHYSQFLQFQISTTQMT